MDFLNILVTNIVSLVIGLGSGVLFYRSRSRKESAEATTSEHSAESVAIENMRESAVEWRDIAESREKKINEKEKKIDALYREKRGYRDEIYSLQQKVNNLELEKQALQFRSCSIRGCATRKPQTGY